MFPNLSPAATLLGTGYKSAKSVQNILVDIYI